MEARGKKTILLVLLGLLIFCLGGFFLLQWHTGNRLRSAINSLMANPPEGMTITVGDLESSLLTKTFVLVNPAVSYGGEGGFAYSADRIELVDPNINALRENAGVMQVAREIRVLGMTGISPGMSMRVEEYRLEDLWADLPWLAREIKVALPDIMTLSADPDILMNGVAVEAFMGRIAGVLKAYETVRAAGVSMSGQRIEADIEERKLLLSMDSSELAGYSLRELGAFVVKGISFSMDGIRHATCESFGWDKVSLPSYADFLLAMSAPEKADNPVSPTQKRKELLQSNPFVLTNMYVQNLLIPSGEKEGENIFSLAESRVSYVMTDTSHDLNLRYEGELAGSLLAATLLQGGEEAVFSLLPEVLAFSGKVEAGLTAREELRYSFDCRDLALAIEDVGSAGVSFAVEGVGGVDVPHLFMNLPLHGRLSRMNLTLTDLAFTDLLFARQAAMRKQEGGPEALRRQIVKAAAAFGEGQYPEAFKELASHAALFLKQPGATLTVALQPSSPVPLQDVLDVILTSHDESLGLSSAVTLNE